MRQFFSSLTWGFLILFAGPTIMIVASWNSLPGDSLYGVKLGLEQALFVLVSPSYAAQGDLSVKYTERRFAEAKRLLSDKGSAEGLQYLDKQVTTTRDVIEKGSDTKTQKELAQKYIDTLTNLSAELTSEQQALASAPPAGSPAQGTTPVAPAARGQSPQGIVPVQQPGTAGAPPVVTPPLAQVQPPPVASPQNPPSAPVVQQQTPPPPPPVVAPQAPPAAVQQQINQTQANIQQTIQELEQVKEKAHQEENKQEEKKEAPQAQPQEEHKSKEKE